MEYNMKIPRNAISQVIEAILEVGAKKATKYLDDKTVVKATRQGKNNSLILTWGRPNYLERKFIKLCKKAGEKFPIRKVQLKFSK